nr:hypothetical protein [Tanacetum cinerariifolium]
MDQQSSELSPPEAGLVVPVFPKGDDPIDAINHMMSFLTFVVASRYPATNNQLRTSSNPRQQATINNGRVTIQPIQGRQNFVSVGSSRPFTSRQGGAQGKQRKRKQFYGYAVNQESAQDVYFKRRIIAITDLQIMKWHDYKHLDWISVHRDDDQIYKFKEGDFKRLCLQDIEDMLLLLVQGKLSNLTIEERLAFNVSLRMFTWSIVIKRRVEDL